MAKVIVHAGDFREGKGHASFGTMILKSKASMFKDVIISFKDFEEVAVATEQTVKRIGGTVGWGIAGAAVLGPVGLLAGLLLGGKGKDVTFVGKLKDGRKLLATTDAKTFTKLQAATFK